MCSSLYEWQLSDGLTLDYSEGDLVGLLAHGHEGPHGLVMGMNTCTGMTGTFSLERGERVPLSQAWMTHQ